MDKKESKNIVLMYDLDGTIINSMLLHGKLAARCMNKLFGMPVSEALLKYHSSTGIPFPDQLRNIFPDSDEDKVQECVKEYAKGKEEEVYNKSKLFPDIIPALKEINSVGFTQVISTSTERELTKMVLKKNGILSYFATVFGMEDGKKPDHIAKIKSIYKPKTIIFIGDSKYDVTMNKHGAALAIGRYGKKSDAMLSKHELLDSGADYDVDDIRDIIPILLKLISK